MNNTLKSYKKVILLGSIACLLIFNSCSTSRYGRKSIEIKKWVNWKIQFKEKTNEEDKGRAMLAIEKYILNELTRQDFPGTIIRSISISINEIGSGKNVFGMTINLRLEEVSKGASPTPAIGPRPPKDDMLPQAISPFIEHIEMIDPQNGTFGPGGR